MIDRPTRDDVPSLAPILVDALVFWLRNQTVFWVTALPIAGLSAGVAYVLEADRQFVDWRHHWGWDFLFALIYAMFFDRWIKEALLDDASPCDEVDELRRSTVPMRFLTFAALLCLAATLLAFAVPFDLGVVPWAAAASLFALLLPGLAAAEPISLRQAFVLGRPLQVGLFLLIGGAAAVSLLASVGLEWGLAWSLEWGLASLSDGPWGAAAAATIAAGQRLLDCLLLAFVGYALAALFRHLTDWQQPEPEDHPFRGMRLRARKA
jgi:hypothetical protein